MKKQSTITSVIIVAVVAVAVTVISVFAVSLLRDIHDTLIGSDACVVAADYSYLTYYGEKYVPLDTKEYSFATGEMLVDEAKVENTTIWDKLFFGERVYSVKGAPDSSIIHLATDYDNAPSEVYVLESKLSEAEEIIANFTGEHYYTVLPNREGYWIELPLKDELVPMMANITNVPQDTDEDCRVDRSQGQERVVIYLYEPNRIFCKEIGEIIYKKEEYYWYDYGDEQYPTPAADEKHPYPIAEEFCDALDELFWYIGK